MRQNTNAQEIKKELQKSTVRMRHTDEVRCWWCGLTFRVLPIPVLACPYCGAIDEERDRYLDWLQHPLHKWALRKTRKARDIWA